MLTINNTLDGYLKDVEIKGNTIQDAENLADIRSVGDKVEGQELYEIPVLCVGKNLAFNSNWFDDTSITSTGLIITETDKNSTTSDFIDIRHLKNEVEYIIPTTNAGGGTTVAFYDINKNFISRVFTVRFTIPKNSHYIKVKTGVDNKEIFQLEEGTQATPYEPYVEDKLTILSPTPLEKVGDVADRIIEKDGVWGVEKNVGTSVFDGSESWVKAANKPTGTLSEYRLSEGITGYYLKDQGHHTKTKAISNKYNYLGTQEHIWTSSSEGFGIGSYKDYGIVYISSNYTRLEEFKQNFGNLIIKYQFEEPQFIPLPHDQQIKLRTFANKTNISFLTEIEGTIKAQVPKSLGATVNTHTEQINNLNNELDRVKKLEESTVSTVTTESDFTTVTETANGYFEDVKLEGKTLVNLADYNNRYVTHDVPVDGVYTKTDSESDFNIMFKPTLAKINTKYTMILDVLECDDTFLSTAHTIANYSADSSTNHMVKKLKKGVNLYLLETSDTLKNIFFHTQLKKGTCKIKIVILEGDHTQNPPSYFEGLKSVGQSATTSEDGVDEIVVSSVNENLFNFDGLTYGRIGSLVIGKYYNEVYLKSNNAQNRVIGLPVRLPQNSNLKFYFKCEGYQIAHTFFDENLRLVRDNSWHSNDIEISPRDKEVYVAAYIKRDDGTIMSQSDIDYIKRNAIIVAIDSFENISYTPHQSDKKRLLYYNNETQTWEKPILRQWDSIEKHANGKYYYHQRSGEVVFNGSESWWKDLSIGANTTRYVTNIQNAQNTNTSNKLICNLFTCSGVTTYGTDVEDTQIYDNSLYVRINTSKAQDVAGFKAWLQSNNITVVYQLAQEKVYECTNIDLITYSGETNYIVESGAIVPRTTLKVHNNISNVVSLLQKKVSLLESNVTSYMITQNRLMLASRYNADTVSFKVDVASFSDTFEYDNDLYELILNNILVGKDNYNREYIENLIIFYWMDFVISDEMYSTLFEIIEEQHNPKIEEETPSI